MADTFDPYYTWLAIPPEEQPPNHYRLIGVREFEDNPDVISNAVDQRMAHLRTFQNGKRASFSQQLLNEISAASGCLLHPAKKNAYDEKLSDEIGSFEEIDDESPDESEADEAYVASPVSERGDFGGIVAKSEPSVVSVRRKAGGSRLIVLLGGLVLGGGGLLAIVLFLVNRANTDDTPGQDDQAAVQKDAKQKGLKQKDKANSVKDKKPASDKAKKDGGGKSAKDGGRSGKKTAVAKKDPRGKGGQVNTGSGRGLQDLLGRLDPTVHKLSGDVRREGRQLVLEAEKEASAAVRLPVNLPTQYQIKMRFLRERGQGSFSIALRVGGRLCRVVVDAFPDKGYLGGLELIEGKGVDSTDYVAVKKGRQIENRRYTDVIISVYGNRVVGECNRSRFLNWRGDPTTLSAPPAITTPQLRVTDGRFAFQVLTIRPLKIRIAGPTKKKTQVAVNKIGETKVGETNGGNSSQSSTNAKPFGTPDRKPAEVPATAELTQALAKVKKIYKRQLTDARTPEQLEGLVAELQKVAGESQADPAAHYTLLAEARRLAVKAKNLDLAFKVRDEMALSFKIDDAAEGLKVVMEAQGVMKSVSERSALADAALRVSGELMEVKLYAGAVRSAEAAARALRGVKNIELSQQVKKELSRAKSAKSRLDRALAAEKKLKTAPDDPAANLSWGKYLCLSEGNWEKGLPFLSKSSHPGFRLVAAMEIQKPANPEQTKTLAEKWWSLGQTGIKSDKASCLVRAHHWYKLAEGQMTGLQKKQIQERLVAVKAALSAVSDSAVSKLPVSDSAIQGLLGRVVADGRPQSLPLHYTDGSVLTSSSFSRALKGTGIRGNSLVFVFRGVIQLDSKSAVQIDQRGSTGSRGMSCALTVDGKAVGQVGGRKRSSGSYQLPLRRGRHLVEWRVSGSSGSCSIQFLKDGVRQPIHFELPSSMTQSQLWRLDQ